MSATKVLDLAEKQGLLDANVIADLRRQVAESKFVVTAEAIAKILVDHGHLTAFQARKLVNTALGEPEPVIPRTGAPPNVPAAKPPPPTPPRKIEDSELGLADSSSHDEIVDMQVAPPVAKPPTAKPPPAKKPSRSHAETRPLDVKPPRSLPPRSVSPSPLVPLGGPAAPAPAVLEPISPPPLRPAPSPLTPTAAPVASPAATALAPVDALSLDPLHAPAGPLTPAQDKAAAKPVRQKPKNPWENPTFLLIGGGVLLGMLVVFGLLYLAIFRTPVAKLLDKANRDYESGSFGAAKDEYEQLLARIDSKSADASLARVRIGMIDFRTAAAEGRNPKPGIEAANRILPELQKEQSFNECRLELRTLLVDMAYNSAKAAQSAKDTAKRETLVAQTEEALKLVDNAAYIPSSLRGEVQARINETLDVLKAARRSIDQDKELAKALAAMKEAIQGKDAAKAYQTRLELLRNYPALEADAGLVETTAAVASMEKGQAKLEEEPLAALTQDEPPTAASVALAHSSGGDSGLSGQYVAALVQGAVYGFDAKDGKLLWRRFVGYDATVPPQPVSGEAGADLLIVDPLRQELARVQAASGKTVWRLPVGKSFTPPILGTEHVYVTTADSRVLEVTLASGQSQRQIRLPQTPSVSPAFDSRRLRLYLLGRQSTLFVFDADRLTCTETMYLGHKAGAIFVPPAVALEHVLVAESPGDDYSLIHALAADPETKKLKQVAEPIRVKGRIIVPLQVDRSRVIAVTDVGQVSVLQVEPANKEHPVRLLASYDASGSARALTYFTSAQGQVYVASQYVGRLEIQATSQSLKSQWQLHAGDTFVAPPQLMGKALIHVRRPKSSLATTVEACQAESGKSIWRTEIAAPVTALTYSDSRQEVAAITSRGRVYEVPAGALAGGIVEKAAYVPLPGSESMSLTDAVELGSGKLALVGPQAGGHGLIYDSAASANRTQQFKFKIDIEKAAAAATFFQGGLALPQQTGQVLLLDPLSAGQKAQPFQPALEAGQRIAWNQPAVIPPDGTALAVSDGLRTIYRLAIKAQPQPHLESLGETVVESDVVAPLASTGDMVFAVIRSVASDIVVALQGSELASAGKTPLSGRIQYGPVGAAGLVFIADENKLHAFDSSGKVKWSQPYKHGLPALAPLASEGDLIVVTRQGAVCRLAADSGEELAAASIGEPAGRAAVIAGGQIVVAGADGALHTVPLPKKP